MKPINIVESLIANHFKGRELINAHTGEFVTEKDVTPVDTLYWYDEYIEELGPEYANLISWTDFVERELERRFCPV
jgi:hypothetical protein